MPADSEVAAIEFGRRHPAIIYLVNDEWPERIAIDDGFWDRMRAAPEFTRIEGDSITFIVEQGEATYHVAEHDEPMQRRVLTLTGAAALEV